MGWNEPNSWRPDTHRYRTFSPRRNPPIPVLEGAEEITGWDCCTNG